MVVVTISILVMPVLCVVMHHLGRKLVLLPQEELVVYVDKLQQPPQRLTKPVSVFHGCYYVEEVLFIPYAFLNCLVSSQTKELVYSHYKDLLSLRFGLCGSKVLSISLFNEVLFKNFI